jgi:hypothetical protein
MLNKGARNRVPLPWKEAKLMAFLIVSFFVTFLAGLVTVSVIIFGVIFLYGGLYEISLRRMVLNIPTSKIRSIALGLVEVKGVVEPADDMIESPLSKTGCVFYKYMNKSDKSYAEERVPFCLKDETGKVLVNPEGARIGLTTKECTPGGRKEFNEYVIKPGTELYVMGTAVDNLSLNKQASGREGNHTSRIMITKGENEKLFYITTRGEKNLAELMKLKIKAILLIGTFFIILGFILTMPFVLLLLSG